MDDRLFQGSGSGAASLPGFARLAENYRLQALNSDMARHQFRLFAPRQGWPE
jgi:hypothetical protein